MLHLLLILLILVLSLWYFYRYGRGKPPGPFPLPFFGTFLDLRRPFHEYLAKLSVRFQSPVVSFEMFCNDRYIVVNDYDVMKECLTKKSHAFSGRNEKGYLKKLMPKPGIIFPDFGTVWREHRKFSVATLKLFGLGKRIMEKNIQEELTYMVEEITKHVDTPFCIFEVLQHSAASVIYSVLAGEKLSPSSQMSPIGNTTFSKSAHYLKENAKKLVLLVYNYTLFKHLSPFKKVFQEHCKRTSAIRDILQEIIEEHQMEFQEDNPRDFIDYFLLETKRNSDVFKKENLSQLLYDFFLAGNETSASTLKWSLLLLLHRPECMLKIQQEIDDVIGSRLPSLQDRDKMHFTRSFIEEVFRLKPVVPLTLRKCVIPVKVGKYTFAAGTKFFFNIWSIHNNKKTFPDAEIFNPERFLDKDNKFMKHDHIIPFLFGPRDCVGRRLAETEIFVFLCGILQKFRLTHSGHLPDLTSQVELITNSPTKFDILFSTR